ncbi:SH3 domain-containing protein [Streptomyces sp. NPDC050400]|uniref:SH3 domain-containing protein n=1 Tax=Streptomyces sp. NPDC050400 TaxID=3365610 RepID=UPI0037AB461F
MAVEGIEDAAQSVEVTAARSYSIAPGYSVNVRSGPGTQHRVVRVLPVGAKVSIFCQKPGETVSGPYGTTKIWDNIAVGEYISDAYVKTGSDGYVAPRCA